MFCEQLNRIENAKETAFANLLLNETRKVIT